MSALNSELPTSPVFLSWGLRDAMKSLSSASQNHTGKHRAAAVCAGSDAVVCMARHTLAKG